VWTFRKEVTSSKLPGIQASHVQCSLNSNTVEKEALVRCLWRNRSTVSFEWNTTSKERNAINTFAKIRSKSEINGIQSPVWRQQSDSSERKPCFLSSNFPGRHLQLEKATVESFWTPVGMKRLTKTCSVWASVCYLFKWCKKNGAVGSQESVRPTDQLGPSWATFGLENPKGIDDK